MPFRQQYCVSPSPGEDIYLFTLSNAKGTEVRITNYGAIITSYKVRNEEGMTNDIVLGFDTVEEYWSPAYLANYPWFGAAVGRYANRIKNAEFSIDGKKYSLSSNKGSDQLHGGLNGFDKKIWQFVSSGETPSPFLELKYLSRDGEEGFPGNLEVLIRYELNDRDELSYAYTASSDQLTAVNLTHHSYFNLHNGMGTIHDHDIRIYASRMLEQDGDLVPTGNILPVANTGFDFRNFERLDDRLARIPEYDTSFIVDQKENPKELSLMAEARLKKTNTLLQVYSTDPVVHFYSGKWTPVVKGKNGIIYGPFSGFCLETHSYLNAVNIPHFPNTLLRPGETYYQKTLYKLGQTWEK